MAFTVIIIGFTWLLSRSGDAVCTEWDIFSTVSWTSCLGTNCRARWREDEPIVSRRWGRRRPWSPSSRFDRRPAKNRREGILISLPSDGIKTRFHRSIGPPECEPEEEKQVCNFFFCTSTTYKARVITSHHCL